MKTILSKSFIDHSFKSAAGQFELDNRGNDLGGLAYPLEENLRDEGAEITRDIQGDLVLSQLPPDVIPEVSSTYARAESEQDTFRLTTVVANGEIIYYDVYNMNTNGSARWINSRLLNDKLSETEERKRDSDLAKIRGWERGGTPFTSGT